MLTLGKTYSETDSYPMELDLMIMLESGYSGPRPKPIQISIGSVHIFSVLVSVSVTGRANEP